MKRILILLMATVPMFATTSFDASSLLTQTTADQLAAWLGEGDLSLTRIYAATSPTDWTAFHAAADGQGRTFTVMQALTCTFDISCILSDAIIGGYNPQSWVSFGGYNIVPLDSDRTAFIFNLTEARIAREMLADGEFGRGSYQTYNSVLNGPGFGVIDINLGANNVDGYTYAFDDSYEPGFRLGTSIAGANASLLQYSSSFTLGTIEVFTIADVATPEPSSALLLGGALIALLASRRRRKATAPIS
ncbi:MAG: PEP_CTERM-anchored TLD domain-containing protein [Acidobacteriota bacterium]